MIDCDLYKSAKEAQDFCKPFILDQAVIIFDDWQPQARENNGKKRAFDEFLRENPEFSAVPTATYDFLLGDEHGKIVHLTRTQS